MIVKPFSKISVKDNDNIISVNSQIKKPRLSQNRFTPKKQSEIGQKQMHQIKLTSVKSMNELKTVKKQNTMFDNIKQPQLEENQSVLKVQTEEKINYYLYWKQKAYEYQRTNFILYKENGDLKQNIGFLNLKLQQLSSEIIQCNKIRDKYQQSIKMLEESQRTEKQLYLHIEKLQQSLKQNKIFLANLQKKQYRKLTQIQGTMSKQLRMKLHKLQLQNTQFIYRIKQYEEYFQNHGIKSIWSSFRNKSNNQNQINNNNHTQNIHNEHIFKEL